MKVALIHDHLIQDGGAEKVLAVLADCYPKAPIYTLVSDSKKFKKIIPNHDIRPSFIQKLPWGVKYYQIYLPLMPWAIESFDLSGFDLVISSASSFAKGVITGDKTVHICYCHTPTRYLWSDTYSYVKELRYPKIIRNLVPGILTRLRTWDRLASERSNVMIANSIEVQKRIKHYYNRDSVVVYPPVDTEKFSPSNKIKSYYLTGGRLVAYKRFDIVINAFNRLKLPLKIFGTGPERERLQKLANSNITFLDFLSEEELARTYAECLAFIHPQVEDFGITVIEAMASGRPVIAYAAGGALESVIPNETGLFFEEQSWEALADTIIRFKPDNFITDKLLAHAKKFSVEEFKNNLNNIVGEVIKNIKQ